MISKDQFKSQMSRISVLFMRETPKEMLREMYDVFKEKDFGTFERAISAIIRGEEKFPPAHTMLSYYEQCLPPRDTYEPISKKDLKKAARTKKQKYYLGLIFGLLDSQIDIEDPRVQQCLNEQGSKKVFSHYDKVKRCFIKMGREPISPGLASMLQAGARRRTGISGTYISKPRDHFKKLREKLGLAG